MSESIGLENENLDAEGLALKTPLPEETEEEFMDMDTVSEVDDDDGNMMEHENSSHMKEQEVSTSLSNLNLVEIENKPSQDCLSIDLNVVDIFEDSKLNDVISSPNDSVVEKENSIRSFNPFNQEHRSIGEARSDLLRIFEAGPPVEKSDVESRKEKELNLLWKSTMNQIEELCVHCPTTIEKSIDA